MGDNFSINAAIIKALTEHPIQNSEWEYYAWGRESQVEETNVTIDDVINGLKNGRTAMTIWVNKDTEPPYRREYN